MHLQINIASVFVVAIAVTLPASAQARKSSHKGGVQTQFSAEDEGVKSPVTLPPEVMGILGKDDMVENQMENEEPRPAQLPQSWFFEDSAWTHQRRRASRTGYWSARRCKRSCVLDFPSIAGRMEAGAHDSSARLDRDANAIQWIQEHRSRCDDVLCDCDCAVSIQWPRVQTLLFQDGRYKVTVRKETTQVSGWLIRQSFPDPKCTKNE